MTNISDCIPAAPTVLKSHPTMMNAICVLLSNKINILLPARRLLCSRDALVVTLVVELLQLH